MSRSNHHTREKRAQRRQAAGPAKETPLVPHTRRCPCAACEDRRKRQLDGDIEDQRKRRRDYDVGHEHPEHRSGWAVTVHALSAFMALHDCDFDRRAHVTHLQMSDEFVDYLDDGLDARGHQRPLDGRLLYDALLMLQVLHPLRGRIVWGCVIERRTQEDLATQETMRRQSVAENLDAARDMLRDLYGGLLLVEQHAQQQAC